MPRHAEQRHLPYTPEQMYDLVADVRHYPDFLPWVIAMRIREDGQTETIADMIVGFMALRETFRSRVMKEPKHHICVDYIEGPLKYLHNNWHFRPDATGGAYVDFEVDFAFRNRLFETMAGQFFETALMQMIGAFETRADALYGSSAGSNSSSAHITA